MRLADTRPPFAGLAKLPEKALASLPTPCYLLDESQLRRNGEILLGVQQRTGCKILLAQKQEALRAGIRELQDSVAYIDWKQNFYDEVLSGKRPYESNLIRVEK